MEENKKTTIQEVKEEIVKDVELEKTVEEISNVKQMSPMRMVIRRFFRSKLSVIGLVIIVGLVVVFFVAATISSYASLTKHMYEPFATEEMSYKLDNAQYIDGEDFTDFKLEFECTEFNVNNKAKFKITTSKFEEQEIDVQSITVRVCLTADYLDYCKYSSENTKHTLDESSSSKTQTYTVDTVEFPAKVDAFPFDIKVKEPVAYVYLQYKVKTIVGTETKIKTHTYILKYDYEDFNVKVIL